MGNEITPNSAELTARQLIEQKDTIENELKEMEQILKGQGVGMVEPLVDKSGFPRDDIDLVAVRTARSKIISLRNDHKDIMKQIEEALHAMHAENKVNKKDNSAETVSISQPRPFAIVNAIAPDSPAKEAGLLKGDEITRFGSIHTGNHQKLQALNTFVVDNEGKSIGVTIKRGEENLVLQLTPRRGWGGRGLLGCHILPL
ncbi:26S proteasome non-ATPase regulatory subunit 9 [Glomus cerebriforme]|uniref:Probable 26S proteasome regulatory subunit p27 n=1 Tax=Glomus cerebriforme TaxID=658196 RepID=A0A397SJ79_9GLOM|nr:26S proteasome non-ATPase regulatory subunit 9 [Glomus cerebriforme]